MIKFIQFTFIFTLFYSSLFARQFSSLLITGTDKNASVTFTENKGQIANVKNLPQSDVRFYGNAGPLSYYLTNSGISYVFKNIKSKPNNNLTIHDLNPEPTTIDLYRLDLQLVGSNPDVKIIADDISDIKSNYYYSHCPAGITEVNQFKRLTYKNIYPDIDMIIYSIGNKMKYDFIVNPGGEISKNKNEIFWLRKSINY